MKLSQFLLLMSVASMAPSVWATPVELIKKCTLDGIIHLKAPTRVMCDKDLKVAIGTQIMTHGFALDIQVMETLDLPMRALRILRSTTEDSRKQNMENNEIHISANSVRGTLEVNEFAPDNQSSPLKLMSRYSLRRRTQPTNNIFTEPMTLMKI